MTSTSSVWEDLPAPSRHALTAAFELGMPAKALALYARWWQLETWLRSLAYVEFRARDGVSWVDNLDPGTTGRQARDQRHAYMASPDWEDPLAYLDAGKLFDLIDANWALFNGELIEQKAWDGRRDELLKVRHRIGHLRRPHSDDLSRLEQTLRDLDKGALGALRAYHRRHDPTLICNDDDPVIRGWIHGEHEDAHLVEHAARNYETEIRVSVVARPWAQLPSDNERLSPQAPGFLWYVEFWSRRNYLRVPELWRDTSLDNVTRKLLVHVLISDIDRVAVTFPMVDDATEVADAIGNLFHAVLTTSSRLYPGDSEEFDDDPLSRLPALDPRVQVQSTWSIELPYDRPITIFSA